MSGKSRSQGALFLGRKMDD